MRLFWVRPNLTLSSETQFILNYYYYPDNPTCWSPNIHTEVNKRRKCNWGSCKNVHLLDFRKTLDMNIRGIFDGVLPMRCFMLSSNHEYLYDRVLFFIDENKELGIG